MKATQIDRYKDDYGDSCAVYALSEPMHIFLSFTDSQTGLKWSEEAVIHYFQIVAIFSEEIQGPYTLIIPCEQYGQYYSNKKIVSPDSTGILICRMLPNFASLNYGMTIMLRMYKDALKAGKPLFL